ncbi:hypothetical protein J2S09_003824 [Bacillus fengqiuensis]|nr:hypothetical protein [Bacillus fengqiuensis]
MNEKIRQEIDEIENKFDVKVLYACESGSRAWGFPSKDRWLLVLCGNTFLVDYCPPFVEA